VIVESCPVVCVADVEREVAAVVAAAVATAVLVEDVD